MDNAKELFEYNYDYSMKPSSFSLSLIKVQNEKLDIPFNKIPAFVDRVLQPFNGVISYKGKTGNVKIEYNVSDKVVRNSYLNIFSFFHFFVCLNFITFSLYHIEQIIETIERSSRGVISKTIPISEKRCRIRDKKFWKSPYWR